MQPISVDMSPVAAASANITDAVHEQLNSALDAAIAVNSSPGAAAVVAHMAPPASNTERSNPYSSGMMQPKYC